MTAPRTRPIAMRGLHAVPQAGDWPDTGPLFVDFPEPETAELLIPGMRPTPEDNRPRLTWRQLGLALLIAVTVAAVVVLSKEPGVWLYETSVGVR